MRRCLTERRHKQVDRRPTVLEDFVFVGTHAVILMGCRIGQPDRGFVVPEPRGGRVLVDTLVARIAIRTPTCPGAGRDRRRCRQVGRTGQRPSDLGVYEQHQRRIRIVAHEAVRDALADRAEGLILPVLERLPML